MKTMSYSMLRSIFALVLGLLFVIFPNAVRDYLVITVGVLFFIPGFISIISFFAQGKEEGEKRFFPIVGLGSLLFGLWLMINPTFFVNILMYLLGFILLLGGIQQIAYLVSARKWARVPTGFYIVPILIFLSGVVILINGGKETASWVIILLGISSIIYAITEMVNEFKFNKHQKKIE